MRDGETGAYQSNGGLGGAPDDKVESAIFCAVSFSSLRENVKKKKEKKEKKKVGEYTLMEIPATMATARAILTATALMGRQSICPWKP